MQIALALLLLEVPPARAALLSLNGVVDALSSATQAGTSFVFGYVGGGEPPFDVTKTQNLNSLAFQALPLVLVMSALSALLWHWRVLPVIVKGFAYVLQKTLSIGGAVGLGSASTIFLGMIEAPLLIRPYLARLTRAELFMLMTVGLSTVAGTVMVLYASVLEPAVPGALGHILVASFISLPAAILVARLMVPGISTTPAEAHVAVAYRSSMDAIARGTEDGLKLYLGIVAMLIVMVALVALADIVIGHLPPVNGAPLTVERIFGWLFWPVVWLYGVPAAEASDAGALLGTKTILNEFIAYLKLAALAGRRAQSAFAADHALCHVRLRQSGLGRHHDRRHFRHGPGAPPGGGGAFAESAGLGHHCLGHDRRGGGAAAGVLIAAPEAAQLSFAAVELVAVAAADTGDVVRLGAERAVGILPQGPARPIRRNHRGRPILRQPEPALGEHGIGLRLQQFLDVVAGIEPGPAPGLLLDMGDEGARFLKRHARPLRVAFEVERQQIGRTGIDGFKEMLRLMDSIAPGAEMIGAEKEPGAHRSPAVGRKAGIDMMGSFRRLLEDRGDSVVFGCRQIHLCVVMRQIDDAIGFRHAFLRCACGG